MLRVFLYSMLKLMGTHIRSFLSLFCRTIRQKAQFYDGVGAPPAPSAVVHIFPHSRMFEWALDSLAKRLISCALSAFDPIVTIHRKLRDSVLSLDAALAVRLY